MNKGMQQQKKTNGQEMQLPPGVTPEMIAKAGGYQSPDISQYLDWTMTDTGFAPYFEPFKGAWFAGIVLKGDTRDPQFERYLFEAQHDTLCRQGPKKKDEEGNFDEEHDDRPVVVVPKDKHFTLGVFYGLKDTLNALLVYQHKMSEKTGETVRVPIFIQFTEKLKKETKSGRHPWQFTIRLHPQHARAIEAVRAKLLGNESDGLPMLPAGKPAGAKA